MITCEKHIVKHFTMYYQSSTTQKTKISKHKNLITNILRQFINSIAFPITFHKKHPSRHLKSDENQNSLPFRSTLRNKTDMRKPKSCEDENCKGSTQAIKVMKQTPTHGEAHQGEWKPSKYQSPQDIGSCAGTQRRDDWNGLARRRPLVERDA